MTLSLPDVSRPVLLLCDWAEVINGKLYIQGGGWTQLRADQPVTIAVALNWIIPWTQANQRHKILLKLVTEDGEAVKDPGGNDVVIEGEMEVGRPPGVKAGSGLGAPMAIKFQGIVLAPGGYRFEFYVNGSLETIAAFYAVGGMP